MERIPLTKELAAFNDHLANNKRVVLSAKYGDGKTTFLDTFKKTYQGCYTFVEIHPLNYSIAPNNDIFEYLKRDILLQLCDEKEALDFNIDLDTLGKQFFNWESLADVIKFILSTHPAGVFASKAIDRLLKVKDEYEEKKKTLPNYLDMFSQQRGGIYERDAYTILIEDTITRINQRRNSNHQTVLIIEDLDRMDPAHIFRILNVFGAHICDSKDTNKFFFSNIIFVMDYEVTEYIFHHFYGDGANYTGYMSKFVSKYPFRFSISAVAKDYVRNFIEHQCGLPIKSQGIIIYNRGSVTERSLSSIIEDLSVRKISDIVDCIENQISKDPIPLDDGGSISPLSPFTKLLAVLVRIGERFSLSGLLYELKASSLLPAVLQQQLMIDLIFRGQFHFKYEEKCYYFEEGLDKNNNRYGYVTESNGYMTDVNVETTVEKVYKKTCLLVKDVDKVAI